MEALFVRLGACYETIQWAQTILVSTPMVCTDIPQSLDDFASAPNSTRRLLGQR